MIVTERELWYLLDTIAVRESGAGGNRAKSDAAIAMMKHLTEPTPAECQVMHTRGYEVRLPSSPQSERTMNDKERTDRLERVVILLLDALQRKDTERDGNWGYAPFKKEIDLLRTELSAGLSRRWRKSAECGITTP